MSIMIDTQEGIQAFHMLAQYHACKLQLAGMQHSSGRSIIAHVKKTYGLKGNNKAVVEQFRAIVLEKVGKDIL